MRVSGVVLSTWFWSETTWPSHNVRRSMGLLLRRSVCGWSIALLLSALLVGPTARAQQTPAQQQPAQGQPAQEPRTPQPRVAGSFRTIVIPAQGAAGQRQSAAIQNALQQFAKGLNWIVDTIPLPDALARSAAAQATR
jgi:hypothetical protein